MTKKAIAVLAAAILGSTLLMACQAEDTGIVGNASNAETRHAEPFGIYYLSSYIGDDGTDYITLMHEYNNETQGMYIEFKEDGSCNWCGLGFLADLDYKVDGSSITFVDIESNEVIPATINRGTITIQHNGETLIFVKE